MKKIYYLQNHEIKLGDIVDYYGFMATVTEKLIELNPELFKVEDITQELLDEAKRRYPIGTVYKHFNSEYTRNSPNMLTVSEMDHYFNGKSSFGPSIWVKSKEYNGVVYADGKWAEILKPKFTTEDGVDIYGDMKTFLIHPNDNVDIFFNHSSWNGDSCLKGYKYFYHKENALAYIKKHKRKSLEDYEDILLTSDFFMEYHWLKDNEPKLYYTKILQLIADDLNDGWVADFNSVIDKKYHISYNRIDFVWTLNAQGIIVFKSEELAEKARALLGDKVKYLFNN